MASYYEIVIENAAQGFVTDQRSKAQSGTLRLWDICVNGRQSRLC